MSQVGIKLNNLQAQISTLAAQSATNPLTSALNANGQNINNVGILTTNTITATTGNFNNIVLPLPLSYNISSITGNFTITVPVRVAIINPAPFPAPFTVGQEIIISGASPYNGTYIIQAVVNGYTFDLSTNPSGSSTTVVTGSVKLNAGNLTCQTLTTTNSTVGTLTFSGDGSSQTTANDVYLNGTTVNTGFPVACVGTSTTGRTSLYTDGVGHFFYNPSLNTMTINNNGKITLNGATTLFQNSNNTLTYRVPSTYKHSFEVDSGTEIAKVDDNGLTVSASKTLTATNASITTGLTYKNTTDTAPTFSAYFSSNVAVVNTSYSTLKMNATNWCIPSTCYNTSTGVFTCPSLYGGFYTLNVGIGPTTVNTQFTYRIQVNSVTFKQISASNGAGNQYANVVSCIVRLNGGDTVSVDVYQNSAVAQYPLLNENSVFQMSWIRSYQ